MRKRLREERKGSRCMGTGMGMGMGMGMRTGMDMGTGRVWVRV